MTLEEKLIDRLTEGLGQVAAADLTNALVQAGHAAAVLELLEELHTVSSKVAAGAVDALPELQRRNVLPEAAAWLDVGVALAETSGAAATKYFKDSPLVLSLLDQASRRPVLSLALELADRDPNVSLDFFRKAPELLTVLSADELPAWAEAGAELAQVDYVLGIEFFRQSPAIARVLPLAQVRPWIQFGMKLITQNSLGKTDYVVTLEFFRTSPAILGGIDERPVRAQVIDLGSALADRSPQLAIECLSAAPALLRRIPSDEWRFRILRYGALVTERDAEAAVSYLRRCPEILALLGPTLPSPLEGEGEGGGKFEQWFRGGMEVLEYSAEGGRAYFALETKKALASVEQAMSGVPLRQVGRSLKLFAQGLCGTDVAIHALPEPLEAGKEPARATVSPDGRTILLPALLRRYPTREENVRLYTIMTAHEAGHLEFGTYDLSLARLADLIADVRRRYGHPDLQTVGIQTLGQVFELYPQPGLIRDLWTVLEDARVEYRLQYEYPGLKQDLVRLAREAVTTRSLTHGMSVREMVVDALLLLSTAEPGTVHIPDAIADVVQSVWTQCQTILHPHATAEDAVRLADRVSVLLDRLVAKTTGTRRSVESEPHTDSGMGPQASEAITEQYRPVTNWTYRGTMNPDLVGSRKESGGDRAGEQADRDGGAFERGPSPAPALREGGPLSQGASPRELSDRERTPPAAPASAADQLLTLRDDRRAAHEALPVSGGVFLYDEWDGAIQDYRSRWCRVVEQVAAEATADFADSMLSAHGPAVRLLRRYFESLRPPGLRRVHGQTDGEELDLDAIIRRAADHAAGAEPSDRLYVRREKRDRDVAVAFLVDLSGSTSRLIESAGRRVIDIEKEGLVLLCEALESVGDQYAIYGYSGRGRAQVDFVVLKEFDEWDRGGPARRIGGVVPLQQNRDGAAIRHAVAKLLARNARIKLLVLLSDGKPLDDGYADEYALEDTKKALQEARTAGVAPFCITVDRSAGDYLKRMYGEVRFLIIDRVEALPERLPRIYRRLTA